MNQSITFWIKVFDGEWAQIAGGYYCAILDGMETSPEWYNGVKVAEDRRAEWAGIPEVS
jgi:hypothetical protein